MKYIKQYFDYNCLSELNNSKFRENLKKVTGYNIKKSELDDIINSLSKDIGLNKYYPANPEKIFFVDKGNRVSRRLVQFNIKDFYLYYYCVKNLQDEIADYRVINTYGGWTFGNRIAKKEKDQDSNSEDNSALGLYPFINSSWSKEFGDFNAKLLKVLKEEDIFNYVVELDIANFYDNVNLHILETRIRDVADRGKRHICDILFHFLSYWDRSSLGYSKKTIGLPQELIGDASRLLANFYLQEYDKFIHDKCCVYNAKYFRYCDDQIIIGINKEDCEELLYSASCYLSTIGLNLNAKKVKYSECAEFLERKFDIEFPTTPEKPTDQDLIYYVDRMLCDIDSHPRSTILIRAKKRLLFLVNKITSNDKLTSHREKILKILNCNNFLSDCVSTYEIVSIQKLFTNFQIDLIPPLSKVIDESYNELQIHNIRSIIKNLEFSSLCEERLCYLKRIREVS